MKRNLIAQTLIAITLILTPETLHATKEYNGDRGAGRSNQTAQSQTHGRSHKPDKPKPPKPPKPNKPAKPFKPTVWDDMNYMGFINRAGQYDEGWFRGGGATGTRLSLIGRPDQSPETQPCHCFAF